MKFNISAFSVTFSLIFICSVLYLMLVSTNEIATTIAIDSGLILLTGILFPSIQNIKDYHSTKSLLIYEHDDLLGSFEVLYSDLILGNYMMGEKVFEVIKKKVTDMDLESYKEIDYENYSKYIVRHIRFVEDYLSNRGSLMSTHYRLLIQELLSSLINMTPSPNENTDDENIPDMLESFRKEHLKHIRILTKLRDYF